MYTRLSYDARVSMHTVLKSFRDGMPVRHDTAEKLSAATGGECSVEELKEPISGGSKTARRKRAASVRSRRKAN